MKTYEEWLKEHLPRYQALMDSKDSPLQVNIVAMAYMHAESAALKELEGEALTQAQEQLRLEAVNAQIRAKAKQTGELVEQIEAWDRGPMPPGLAAYVAGIVVTDKGMDELSVIARKVSAHLFTTGLGAWEPARLLREANQWLLEMPNAQKRIDLADRLIALESAVEAAAAGKFKGNA